MKTYTKDETEHGKLYYDEKDIRKLREEVAALKGFAAEPVHFRAVLDADQIPQRLKTSMHVVGFRTWKAADEFVASERDMNGWRYTIEPLYTSPPKAAPLTDDQIVSMVEGMLTKTAYNYSVAVQIGIRAARAVEQAHGITPATIEKG